jgi:hypothetical protein
MNLIYQHLFFIMKFKIKYNKNSKIYTVEKGIFFLRNIYFQSRSIDMCLEFLKREKDK